MSAANAELRTRLAEVRASIAEQQIRLQELEDIRMDIQHFKDGPNSSEAPLLLSQICREWRSIAISTPRLWVDLHLDLEYLQWDEEEDLEAVIVEWFSRAGSCPLSFSVRGCSGLEQFESEAIRNTLLCYAPQLQRIALQLEQVQFMSYVGIPILAQLVIALPFLEDEDEEEFLGLEIFDDAPKLGQLHFGASAMPWMFDPSHTALTELLHP
ncbi:hypothetical protein DFH09DRAFT_1092917 [Mycena vulgaris]|nr:hypothetical protein DFH09DRAFT_1092917 [Mycena vulgaris]